MMTRNQYETRRFAAAVIAVVIGFCTLFCVVGATVAMIAH